MPKFLDDYLDCWMANFENYNEQIDTVLSLVSSRKIALPRVLADSMSPDSITDELLSRIHFSNK